MRALAVLRSPPIRAARCQLAACSVTHPHDRTLAPPRARQRVIKPCRANASVEVPITAAVSFDPSGRRLANVSWSVGTINIDGGNGEAAAGVSMQQLVAEANAMTSFR